MDATLVRERPARPSHASRDRVFYTGMALAMAVTAFAGFSRTYYLRAFFETSTFSGATSLSPTVHVHGLLFSAWVLLFLVQTALVAKGRVALHRRLGMASVGLAAAMIVVGLQTAIAAGRRGSAPPGIDPLVFMVVPIFDILLFTGFVTAAVWMRRNKEAHKRLMLLAYVSIITAAVARIPGLLPLGPLVFFALTFLFIVAGMIYDYVSRRKIHPAYIWGGAIFFVSVPGRLALSSAGAWRSFAEFLIR